MPARSLLYFWVVLSYSNYLFVWSSTELIGLVV